jgi:hypothetical protein
VWIVLEMVFGNLLAICSRYELELIAYS